MARQDGYLLGMNRDEQRTRPRAFPPATHEVNGRRVLFPSEPKGGTWIGVNDALVSYALINWYSVRSRVAQQALSRGDVTRSVLGSSDPGEAGRELLRHPLQRVNPFRLIGFFPHHREIVEWRWDLQHLRSLGHPWEANIWISSGYDEAGAQRLRRETFEQAVREGRWTESDSIRALHSAHQAGPGPYSICMHRSDAVTVSYTGLEAASGRARINYVNGPPCERDAAVFECSMERSDGRVDRERASSRGPDTDNKRGHRQDMICGRHARDRFGPRMFHARR